MKHKITSLSLARFSHCGIIAEFDMKILYDAINLWDINEHNT